MAVDISRQLEAIRNAALGEVVLSNIVEASETLVNEGYDTDIAEELLAIRKGTYGRDIRYAILDALYKLSIAPSGGDGIPKTKMTSVYSNGTVQGLIVNMEVVE